MVRKFLRNIIREQVSLILEANKTQHFNERVFDRLKSDNTTFIFEKEEVKRKVFDDIDFISKINFPGQDNIGVLIHKGGKDYVYKKTFPNGKSEQSNGRFIWIVIRGNDLDTIIFYEVGRKPMNTQIHLTANQLRKYIEKTGNFDLTEKDLYKLKEKIEDPAPQEKVEVEKIVNIDGVKWIVDVEKQILYKKNNPSVQMDVWDFLETATDQKQKDEVLSYLI